jgi:hypothetical protein
MRSPPWRGQVWVKINAIIETERWSKSLDFGLPINYYQISALRNSRLKRAAPPD